MLLVPKSRVTAEHVLGVVVGHAVVYGVIYPCHMWSMSHITHINQCDTISIQVASSLDHYITDKVHGLWSWFQKAGKQLSMSWV